MNDYKLVFVDKVIDNVHGFIQLTQLEKDICNLPAFKRLSSIKHLGFSNSDFPNAEHTRYVHSLGVMHVIDKMAKSLNFDEKERQLVRVAGLLHDLGHYPLSHIGEATYRNVNVREPITRYDSYKEKQNIKKQIDDFCKNANKIVIKHMEPSKDKFHHEQITKAIVLNNKSIKEVIEKNNCQDFIDLNDVVAMITGDVSYNNYSIADKVQLLHSEIDADRIDYSMRDCYFTGTSFGDFGLEFFLENLEIQKVNGIKIVCVKSGGVSACDQFLINRLFSYENVVYNKKTSSLSFMAQIVLKYGIYKGFVKNQKNVLDMITNDDDTWMFFNDVVFWDLVEKLYKDYNNSEDIDQSVYNFVKHFINKRELNESNRREIVIKATPKEFKKIIKNTEIYKNLDNKNDNYLPRFLTCDITKHMPLKEFENAIKDFSKEEQEKLKLHRLLDGVVIKHKNGEINHTVDDRCSFMSTLYNTKLYLLREYEIENI